MENVYRYTTLESTNTAAKTILSAMMIRRLRPVVRRSINAITETEK
jgi:hypothetical protein